MVSATEALQRLQEGNRRYVSGDADGIVGSPERRRELVGGQTPFAIVLGCSDSRVPVEILFDQGFGDLFVVRVAGNIATAPQIGSIEFAASQFGTKLAVVLGHSGCGAVGATLAEIGEESVGLSPNLQAIVEAIRPAVESVVSAEGDGDPGDVAGKAIRANVREAAARLRRESKELERLIRDEGFLVVGAEYCLETGVVDFFEGMPTSG